MACGTGGWVEPRLLVELPVFCALMDEALGRAPMPRAYLLPSQSSRTTWEEPTFKPALCNKSKVRTTNQNPAHLPTH